MNFREYCKYRLSEADARDIDIDRQGREIAKNVGSLVLDQIPGWKTIKTLWNAFGAIKSFANTVSIARQLNEQFNSISQQLKNSGLDSKSIQSILVSMYDVPEDLAGLVPPLLWGKGLEDFISVVSSNVPIENKVFSKVMYETIERYFGGLKSYGQEMQQSIAENMSKLKALPSNVKEIVQKASKENTNDNTSSVKPEIPKEGQKGFIVIDGKTYEGSIVIINYGARKRILLVSSNLNVNDQLFDQKYGKYPVLNYPSNGDFYHPANWSSIKQGWIFAKTAPTREAPNEYLY